MRLKPDHPKSSDFDLELQHAASFGGYDELQDDFDYEEFIADEFQEDNTRTRFRNRWKYVSIILLIVFALLFLVQFL